MLKLKEVSKERNRDRQRKAPDEEDDEIVVSETTTFLYFFQVVKIEVQI